MIAWLYRLWCPISNHGHHWHQLDGQRRLWPSASCWHDDRWMMNWVCCWCDKDVWHQEDVDPNKRAPEVL